MSTKKPLGMPVGSVRAIITIIVVVAALMFEGMILYQTITTGQSAEIPAFVLGLVGTVVGYYFGVRSQDTESTEKLVTETKKAEQYKPTENQTTEPDEIKHV